MNWDDARLFLAVARAGQMLAAARRLGINQATLSRRMAALEAQLGTRLLHRRTHGCELTDAGTELLAGLERAEAEMIAARARLSPDDGTVSGIVRIGAPDGFGVAFLAPRLGRLAARHPGLTLQLVPVPRAFSLSQREADIAVLVGRPDQGRLVVRKLTDYTLGLYAAPSYLAQAGTPASSADLPAHRLIGYVEDLIVSPQLNYTAEIARNWRAQIEISSATGQAEAVRAGAGIGILHDFLVGPDSGLASVLPALSITRAYWLAYHETQRDLRRVQVVARFLAQIVAEARSTFVRGPVQAGPDPQDAESR